MMRSQSIAPGPDKPKQQWTVVCDKCDERHPTDQCPYFKKDREKHKSAWENYGKKGVVSENREVTYAAADCNIIRQPGDGSCLYHSLAYGLRPIQNVSAANLRKQIASFMEKTPDVEIADTPLSDWVKYDSGASAGEYAKMMSYGSRWGGAIEMAACTRLFNVNVHVYSRTSKGYTRISTFANKDARQTVSVSYEGNCHYNTIEISPHAREIQ
jgi:hypothetical protein